MATDNNGNYIADMGPQPADPVPIIAFWLLGAGNPNTLGITALPYSGFIDYTNDLLYVTTDGTTWTAVAGGGGGGTIQISKGAFVDPNGSVTPADPTKAAVYYQDVAGVPYPTSLWKWSVADQVWYGVITP